MSMLRICPPPPPPPPQMFYKAAADYLIRPAADSLSSIGAGRIGKNRQRFGQYRSRL